MWTVYCSIAENRRNIYSSDEEGSDFEARRAKKLDKAKALKDSDEEESKEEDGGESAEEASERADSGGSEDEWKNSMLLV